MRGAVVWASFGDSQLAVGRKRCAGAALARMADPLLLTCMCVCIHHERYVCRTTDPLLLTCVAHTIDHPSASAYVHVWHVYVYAHLYHTHNRPPLSSAYVHVGYVYVYAHLYHKHNRPPLS